MWRVVSLGALLIWCFGVTDTYSSFDDAPDYWYSNDDGIILDSLTPYTLYRSHDLSNNSNVFRSHSKDIVRRLGKLREIEWMLKFDDDGRPIDDDQYNRRSAPLPPLKRDSTVNSQQKYTTPGENWLCSEGPDKRLDICNHCVCVGGQLYFCTAKKCEAPDAAGVNVYRPYRERQLDTCIEGEIIQSFDCNRCWCSGGKVLCTVKTCSKPRDTPNNRLRPIDVVTNGDNKCKPGDPQLNIDNCNTCGCNRRGELFCSSMTCGIKASSWEDKEVGCIENKWYSLSDMHGSDLQCRECYCINGKYSYCYMKLCKGTLEPPEGYSPMKLKASITHATCKPGTEKHDGCTECKCTSKREWRCYTRLIDKCSDKSDIRTNDDQQKLNGNIVKVQGKAPDTKQQRLHGREEDDDYYENRSVNVDYYSYSEETTTRKTTTTTTKKQKKKRKTTTTTPEPEYEYETEEESIETTPARKKKIKQGLQTTTKKGRRPNRNSLPEGTQCEEGEAFNQGTKDNCQGCFCTAEGLWKCYSVKTPCEGWMHKRCWIGAFDKNDNIPCSYCYCGKTAYWMCFTDVACAKKISKTNCDAIICADNCKGANWTDGFCHQDKCVCL